MAWCLPKHLTNACLEGLKKGKIDPNKLSEMSSAERRTFFSEMLGEENAAQVNTLFESKLLLKNQQRGMVNWAKTVGGLKPEVRKDLLSKIEKMQEVLTPENEKAFLEDLVTKRLGTNISFKEATDITNFSKEAQTKKGVMEAKPRRTKDTPTDSELDYGYSFLQMKKYVEGLQHESMKRSPKEWGKDFMKNPVAGIMDVLSNIGATGISLKAAWDNSFIGRQGSLLFIEGLTDPKSMRLWGQTFGKSYQYIVKTFGKEPALDRLFAEIISDPKIDMLQKAKVDLGVVEEAMPGHWVGKIPALGKLYQASENAFVGSATYMRYKLAKMYFDIAERQNVDLTNKAQLESIGSVVNSLTSRGKWLTVSRDKGKPGIVNNILWSPKNLKGDIDVLLGHSTDRTMTSFARKRAGNNLLRIIVGNALIMGVSNLVSPGSAPTEPTDADFGTIKIGNNRYQYMKFAPILTLTARIAKKIYTKDGVVKPLNTGKYGSLTALDMFYSFYENKSAPLARVGIDYMKGETFDGEKFTLAGAARTSFSPLPYENYEQLKNDKSNKAADVLLGVLMEQHGISVKGERPKETKLNIKPSKEFDFDFNKGLDFDFNKGLNFDLNLGEIK
jgi:hypothetical protein